MSDARTQLVADGYDTMADTWEQWSSHIGNDPRRDWLGKLVARLEPGSTVVELGCGNGTAEDIEGWHGDWLGVPMYFSSFTPERNRELLAPFDMLEDEVVTISEADGAATFHWVLARR
jgi:hypothetical protein